MTTREMIQRVEAIYARRDAEQEIYLDKLDRSELRFSNEKYAKKISGKA